MIKTKQELEKLKIAATITDAGLTFALENIKSGTTERELANKIADYFNQNADGVSFDPIVAFKTTAESPWNESGNRVIKGTGALLIDLGCVYQGYCGDLTRMVYIGRPTQKFMKIYDTVLQAQKAAEDEIKLGEYFKNADIAARRVLTNQKLEQYFSTGLGHGVGKQVHENPRIKKGCRTKIQNNMVFTLEPGVYIKGWGGVRIEDTYCFINGKLQQLTKSPKNLFKINI